MVQNIEFFLEPSPHIIIDEFFTPKQARLCLEECIKLEPNYKQAEVLDDAQHMHHYDDCDECKRLVNLNRVGIRDNRVVYLDKYYEGKRSQSAILNHLHSIIQNRMFIDYFNTLPSLFPILKHVKTSESILSAYGKCDFYGFHLDTIPNSEEKRILTVVVYLNNGSKFEGGELIITGKTIHDQKKISPKNNMAVIFQSGTTIHAVNSVNNVEKFEDSRFSINFWLGFDGTYRFN